MLWYQQQHSSRRLEISWYWFRRSFQKVDLFSMGAATADYHSVWAPFFLWNPKIQYLTSKGPPLDSVLRNNEVPLFQTIYLNTNTFSSHPHLGFPSELFPSDFSNNIFYELLIYPISATCSVHLIFRDLIILRIQTYCVFFNLHGTVLFGANTDTLHSHSCVHYGYMKESGSELSA